MAPFAFYGPFSVCGAAVRCVLQSKLIYIAAFFLLVGDNIYLTKYYHAAKIGRIFFGYYLIFADHAEGGFGAVLQSIQFMAAFCTVEIDVFPVIKIAERYCIRVTHVAVKSQHSL